MDIKTMRLQSGLDTADKDKTHSPVYGKVLRLALLIVVATMWLFTACPGAFAQTPRGPEAKHDVYRNVDPKSRESRRLRREIAELEKQQAKDVTDRLTALEGEMKSMYIWRYGLAGAMTVLVFIGNLLLKNRTISVETDKG